MKCLILLSLVVATINLFAQAANDTTSTREIVLVAEKEPQYPGGREELYKYIGNTVRYPKKARKEGVEGTVVVSFIVERDGNINQGSITIEQSVHPLLDEEVIRIVKLLPKWTPATASGRNVRAKTAFPVQFALR